MSIQSAGEIRVLGQPARYLAKRAFYGFQEIASTLIWPYFCFQKRFFPRNQARILTYHCVSEFPKEREIPYDNVPPHLFRAHMHLLKKEHFNIISLSELADVLEANKIIPPRTIIVTFDDGYKNNYLNAFQVLEEVGFKATFFVIAAGFGINEPFKHLLWDEAARNHYRKDPGSRIPMDAQELRKLREHGHEIGSHGMTHRSIGNLSHTEGMEEIVRSRETLEKAVGDPVTFFAYPFGARSYNDFNQRTSNMLRQAGYRAACTGEIGAVTHGTSRYELVRIPVRETDSPYRFRQKLCGAFEWINPFKRAFQKTVPRIDKVI